MARLDALVAGRGGGLAVVWGRRRVGKTRLLVEWARKHGGAYLVADQSAADIQRQYVAEAISERLPGFADVTYPDWRRLFERLARDAAAKRFRGPFVFDEIPYLATSSPELASVLQRFIDHDAADAKLVVAIAGSSQRMMQGLALDASAPLFGRAQVALQVSPLGPSHLLDAFGASSAVELIEAWTAWGGVPRYWELAAGAAGSTVARIEHLVLDPMGPLHGEAERVLLEEVPTAMEVRPRITVENLTKGTPPSNARSILSVLSAAVQKDDNIRIIAEGEDESDALEAL
ncbi:MAG: ATP-binding protein, partial [Polyangiales bacterium]